jgi:hypothetical protein
MSLPQLEFTTTEDQRFAQRMWDRENGLRMLNNIFNSPESLRQEIWENQQRNQEQKLEIQKRSSTNEVHPVSTREPKPNRLGDGPLVRPQTSFRDQQHQSTALLERNKKKKIRDREVFYHL